MFLHVTQARHLRDYQIEVIFNDGRSGVADLTDALLGPMFEPLRDVAVFSRVQVDPDMETIVWPNGADMAPEFLYFSAFKDESALHEQFRQWGYLV